jgi:hypothetical protein
MEFLNHKEGVWFLLGFPPLSSTVYSVEAVRLCIM